MPAIITHHLFGEQSATLLPEGVISTEEELLAFILGNQGPDPFFFRFTGTPKAIKNSMHLAHVMHDGNIYRAFSVLRESVSRLPKDDASVGRAFALGVLSHYALDRAAHPFVYAQQYAIIAANPDLRNSGSEVHAVIESDIDSWMLWQKRHSTVLECPPASELAYTDRILQVAGALTSQVAWSVFGTDIKPSAYPAAVKSMELLYKVIEPAGSLGARATGKLEGLAKSDSLLQALSHQVVKTDSCASANLEHIQWKNPFTGETSNESFADCFDRALSGWADLALAFTHGGDELKSAIGGLNYSGAPVE